MGRFVEKAILAGAVGLLGFAGCAPESSATITRTSGPSGILKVDPGQLLTTGTEYPFACAGLDISVDQQVDFFPTDKQGNLKTTARYVVVTPPDTDVVIGPGTIKPETVYCESISPGISQAKAIADVEAKMPKGVTFVVATLSRRDQSTP